MRIVYCSDPIKPSRVDEAFSAEASAARSVGLEHSLVDYEALVAGDTPAAVRRVDATEALGVYRGWMLTPTRYSALYEVLATRGVRLVNDPTQYAYAHCLPNNYADLGDATPESIFIPIDELDWRTLGERLRPFGDRALVVKDWVKSRKHEWDEACFIPSAADTAAVERVARRFVTLQGEDLVGGLVFRAFERFTPLGTHARSGMPLTKELRLFCVDGSPIFEARYWEGQEYGGSSAPTSALQPILHRLRSRFVTVDVAERTDGAWRVVEIGDGQVSGLPEDSDAADFYRALMAALRPIDRAP